MTIKERIFNNLSERNKVELSAQKVELSLIDDIKSEMIIANKGAISAIDLAFKALPLAEKSMSLNKNLLKKIEKTKQSAKDLGANDVLKVLEKSDIKIRTNIKEIQKLIKGLNSI